MHRYKVTIAYDGTSYHGWQVQHDRKSIAQTLQDTFARIFSENIVLAGVSRTDAGVHAHKQIATFTTQRLIMPACIERAWNHQLPLDIAISSVESVPLAYNPFYDIDYKIYWYYIFLDRPLPMVSRYGWKVRSGLCVGTLTQALQIFVGTHDFCAFATEDDRGIDTIRSIYSIDVEYDQRMSAYKIVIKGPKFLRHMIRRIVGASVEVALRSDLSVDFLQMLLHDRRLTRTLVSAPARGLILHAIIYK